MNYRPECLRLKYFSLGNRKWRIFRVNFIYTVIEAGVTAILLGKYKSYKTTFKM